VYFFAMNAPAVAVAFKDHEALLRQVESRIQNFERAQIQTTLEAASAICEGNLPSDCDPDFFHALCWLAELTSEKIDIPGFTLFRSLDYLESIGIWPLLQRSRPPISVPVCSDPPPEVGFITAGEITSTMLPCLKLMENTETDDGPDVVDSRQKFSEVVESVAEDNLDMLAVLLVQ